jgi:hypothetical protein
VGDIYHKVGTTSSTFQQADVAPGPLTWPPSLLNGAKLQIIARISFTYAYRDSKCAEKVYTLQLS